MGVTYEHCDAVVKALLAKAVSKWHKDLSEAEVTVGLLFAVSPKNDQGEPKGPAVKLHGYPCAAVVRITPYKKRVQGLPDAEITIDQDWWENAHEDERIALLDHELTHLEVQYDDNGTMKVDDHERPKLKMRLHDHQLGIFKSMVERHGAAAPDTKISKQFCDDMGQLLMDFASVG